LFNSRRMALVDSPNSDSRLRKCERELELRKNFRSSLSRVFEVIRVSSMRVTGYELRVTGYGLRDTGYGLRVAGYGLRERVPVFFDMLDKAVYFTA
jgi:hypothetical protein